MLKKVKLQAIKREASWPAAPKLDRTTAMDLCNRYLFTFGIGIILLSFVGCILRRQIIQAGLPISPKLTDIPLLFGLLVMLCGTFNFYKKVIEAVGEPPGAALYSVLGMAVTAALPVLLLFNELISFRYLILGLYGILVVIKNDQLRRRFAGNKLGLRFRVWERRAAIQTGLAWIGGVLFYLIIDLDRGRPLLQLLLGRPFQISAHFEQLSALLFNVAFLVVTSLAFVKDQRELNNLDTVAESELMCAAASHRL